MPHSQPPSVDGTLCTCVKRAMEWPADAYPAIFLDRPVLGKTVLNGSDIQKLAAYLG
jgi:hypothetical protein